MRSNRKTRLECLPLERRDVPSTFRSFDGKDNNAANPFWGSAGIDLLRRAASTYADGVSAPTVGRPNPRAISNAVADQGEEIVPNTNGLAAMAYVWGQFIDHDMSLTRAASPAQSFNVTIPAGDAHFGPNAIIPLQRSAFNPATGTTTPRQQINLVTAWIDGSQIYGSDAATADKLRSHVGGRMKVGAGNMLPFNDTATFPTGTLPMENNARRVPDSQMYAAGDVRANENVELTALQALFVREHNRVADAIRAANPTFSDETIYQKARAWVIAEIQAITYNEWLPTLLGFGSIPAYFGYKSSVNPGIANEFSTAGFRVGHSMLGDDVRFLDNHGMPIAADLPLSGAFFNPTLITEHGIDPILKYMVSDSASRIDNMIVHSVRNMLGGPPTTIGLDLASLNIQRGRDHGLADYNSARVAYGLPRISSFSQITSNVELRNTLQSLYGDVNKIDLWVGMLAEDHVPGGNAGPLAKRIIVDQFTRLRDGDKYWYERTFSGAELNQLRKTTLADVLQRNTALTNLQDNVFTFKASLTGMVFDDRNGNGKRSAGEFGIPGRTIELVNVDSNKVVGTTITDAKGYYMFQVADGFSVGRYQVRVVLPPGVIRTTSEPPIFVVTRGDVNIRGVNIGIATAPVVPPTSTKSASTPTSIVQKPPIVFVNFSGQVMVDEL